MDPSLCLSGYGGNQLVIVFVLFVICFNSCVCNCGLEGGGGVCGSAC